MSDIQIYRDPLGYNIVVKGTVGEKFINSIIAQPTGTDKIRVLNTSKSSENFEYLEIENQLYTSFKDGDDEYYYNKNGASYNRDDVVNLLNQQFRQTSSPVGNAPVITSPLTVNVTEGDYFNYELTATDGVGFEILNLPDNVTNQAGTNRIILGYPTSGTYNVTLKVYNSIAVDEKTLVITVDNPPFSNTKSIKFDFGDYLEMPVNNSNPMYRNGDGSGASDAWSWCGWFKSSTNGFSNRCIMSFGSDDSNTTNQGRIELTYRGISSSKKLRLRYGRNGSYLIMETPDNSIITGQWQHIAVGYTGNSTSSSEDRNEFWIAINGVKQTLSGFGSGFSESIGLDGYRVGNTIYSFDYLYDDLVDDYALFDFDITNILSEVYNSGVPQDLSAISLPPIQFVRNGDAINDAFPTMRDQIGSLDATMVSMAPENIVNDVP